MAQGPQAMAAMVAHRVAVEAAVAEAIQAVSAAQALADK
jgi:hypothetical protein